MKYNNTILIIGLLALYSLLSCQKPMQTGVLVDFNGTFNGKLYLSYLESQYVPNDTTTLRHDGVYYFNFKNKPFGCYKLLADSIHSFEFVWDSDTIIKINAMLNEFDDAAVAGSHSAKVLKIADGLIEQLEEKIQILMDYWQITDPKQLPKQKRDSLIHQMEILRKACKNSCDSLINENPSSFANIHILNKKTKQLPLYNIIEDFNRFNMIADQLAAKYPKNGTIDGFKKQLVTLQPLIGKINNMRPGNKIIEIEMMMQDSTIKNLSTQHTEKKAIFIGTFDNHFDLQNHFMTVIQPLKQKGYNIFETFTDSVPAEYEAKWFYGIIYKPKNYFKKMPLPIIILIDTDQKIIFKTPYITDLKEQLTNL